MWKKIRKNMSKKEQLENQNMTEEDQKQELFTEQEESTTAEDFDMEAKGYETTIEHIQEELKTVQQEHSELKNKYMRLYAEFENHKKRTVKEKVDLMKTASQDIMSALLPVLDDFDRAKDNEELSAGISLVYQKLYKVLQDKGLQPMDSNGEPFDPELHEAFTEMPAPSEDMKGKVVDTIEKGYKLGDKIIRHAKVVVGK